MKTTRINLVLSKDNWEQEIKSAKLSLARKTCSFWPFGPGAGKKTIGYPQVDPARFENILLYEIENIVFDGKHVASN